MYNTAPISSHALSLAPMRVDTRSLSTVSCVAVCSAEPLPCPCVLGRCLSCPRLSCCVGYKHHNVTLSLARAARTHGGSAARWRPCCAPRGACCPKLETSCGCAFGQTRPLCLPRPSAYPLLLGPGHVGLVSKTSPSCSAINYSTRWDYFNFN